MEDPSELLSSLMSFEFESASQSLAVIQIQFQVSGEHLRRSQQAIGHRERLNIKMNPLYPLIAEETSLFPDIF